MSKPYNTPAAAGYTGLSPRTLEKLRITGAGPHYRKLGTRVVYLEDDLVEWLDTCRRRSTSDLQCSTDNSPLGGSSR